MEKFNDKFTYKILLKRINSIIDAHPKTTVGIVIKQPIIRKISGNKTSWDNYDVICDKMGRQKEHVISYLLSELRTVGSVTSKGLLLKGRYNDHQIKSLIRKYAILYVICAQCKNSKTKMEKDQITKLNIITCENCKSVRTVY